MNLQETLPITNRDRVTAMESAILSDEAALGQTATSTFSDVALTALAAPSGTAVTQGGTAGTTNYTYVIADVGNVGMSPAAGVQTTTGNATLTAGNNNIITWNSVAGHTYNIYRSASSGTPSGVGLIGSVTAAAGTFASTFTDTGIVATSNVPTANSTGSLSIPGPIFCLGTALEAAAIPQLSNASGQTLTVSQMLNQLLKRTGAVAVSDTTPTAAAIVAALKGVANNMGFYWSVKNANSGTLTIAGGTSVTINGTATIATVNCRYFLVQVTNAAPGSEAVVIESLGVSAY